MFTLLADTYMLDPAGALSVCGVLYLIFCIMVVRPRGDFGEEVSGLIFVGLSWICCSALFLFFAGDKCQYTIIKGKEITKAEIVYVDDYLSDRRKDVGSVEGWKQLLILDSLTAWRRGGEYKSPALGYEYYYRNSLGLPRWFYHPGMWFLCPIISFVFSRPFWAAIFLNSILKRS